MGARGQLLGHGSQNCPPGVSDSFGGRPPRPRQGGGGALGGRLLRNVTLPSLELAGSLRVLGQPQEVEGTSGDWAPPSTVHVPLTAASYGLHAGPWAVCVRPELS